MLTHRVCPQCGAENLDDEPVCFACGAAAQQPRTLQERPPETPWVFYLGALALLVLFAVAAFYVTRSMAGYRQQAGVPLGTMLLLAIALAFFGQYGFALARRQDRSHWEQARAPQLPMKEVGPGDGVWLRGTIACHTPLDVPFLPGQQCVYYELLVQERDADRNRGWHTTQHEVRVVDFMLQEGEEGLYVPSGDLDVKAPICVDTLPDDTLPESSTHVKVSALLVGWQVSVCGRVVDGPPRRLGRLSEEVPAVVTCQYANDYLADLLKSQRRHRALGWVMSVLAAVVLIATWVKG